MNGRDEGAAPIELVLGVGLLLLPIALAVLSLAPWVERRTVAGVAAAEAARLVALADDTAEGERAALTLVHGIAGNHQLAPADISVSFCPPSGTEGMASTCAPAGRGQAVTVEVTVLVPALSIPGVGSFGQVQATALHTELVDLYRSRP